ncbi:MAG: hypothetical protein ACREDZ_13955 [Kiloniellales bacterium]
MIRDLPLGVALAAALALSPLAVAPAAQAADLTVTSDKAVAGFPFPETVGCDAAAKELYVGEFVSALKPTEKDGQGRIKKTSLSGEVLEETFLPADAGPLHKPKGIWVAGNRLWVADIDTVWVYDLESKKGRSLPLPGAQFANDTTIIGDKLFVSDNQGDQVFMVEPADFLEASEEPKVTIVVSGKSVNPNGIYPALDGSLLMGGFVSDTEPRAIYSVGTDGEPKALTKALGRIDGLYQLTDGSLLATDWDSGALIHWSAEKGVATLAEGFKGPADLCVIEEGNKLTVAVPDLVTSELRLIELQQ